MDPATMYAAATLGSAVLGGMGASKANKAAAQASAENLAFQKQMYQQQDPFSAGGNRAQYVPQLNALMQGGVGGLVNDPTYMGLQKQGQQAVERTMAARGMGGSGNEMSAILKQHMGLGMDYFTQQYNRLATLSGAMSGRTAPMTGMSPETAANLQYNKSGAQGEAFGMGMSGIMGLFGKQEGSTTSAGPLNQYSDPSTWGPVGPGENYGGM